MGLRLSVYENILLNNKKVDGWHKRILEISSWGLIKALSRNLLEGTEENQENMSEKQVSQSRRIKVTVWDNCDHKKHSQHSVQKNIQVASKYTYFCTIKTGTEMQVLGRDPTSAPQKWRQRYQPKCWYLYPEPHRNISGDNNIHKVNVWLCKLAVTQNNKTVVLRYHQMTRMRWLYFRLYGIPPHQHL